MRAVDIEERAARHRDGLRQIVGTIHDADGYPPFFPGRDVEVFLAAGEPIAAWVAVDPAQPGNPVVGHVALHRETTSAVIDLATARLGVAPDELGVIARLLVAPSARRCGLGVGLLDHAVADCRRRGLVPVLDVVDRFAGAIALYESAGWRRLGAVEAELPDGTTLRELVYTLGDAPRPTGRLS